MKTRVIQLEAALPPSSPLRHSDGDAIGAHENNDHSLPKNPLSHSEPSLPPHSPPDSPRKQGEEASVGGGGPGWVGTMGSRSARVNSSPRSSLLIEQKSLFTRRHLPNRVIQSSYVPAAADRDAPSATASQPLPLPLPLPRTAERPTPPSRLRRPTLGLDLLGKAKKTTVAFKTHQHSPRGPHKRKSLTYEEILAESLHRERSNTVR